MRRANAFRSVEPHDVARADLLDRAAPALRKPAAGETMSVWPNGWVCHAVRAPGSKVTAAPATRAGSRRLKQRVDSHGPVNQSGGPLADGCEPARLMSIVVLLAVSGLLPGQLTTVDLPRDSFASARARRHRRPALSKLRNSSSRNSAGPRSPEPNRTLLEQTELDAADLPEIVFGSSANSSRLTRL
jgi:hypothetical protein